jgi:hypothetical protein
VGWKLADRAGEFCTEEDAEEGIMRGCENCAVVGVVVVGQESVDLNCGLGGVC